MGMRQLRLKVVAMTLTRSALVCWSWRNELVLALIADVLVSSIEWRHYSRSLALGMFRPFGNSAFGEFSHMGAW